MGTFKHGELVTAWKTLGEKLKYNTQAAPSSPYPYDVVWRKAKREPFMCMEICDAGTLEEDLAALQWAAGAGNWAATCVLAVPDEQNKEEAERHVGRGEEIWVMDFEKAASIANLLEKFAPLFKVLLGMPKGH